MWGTLPETQKERISVQPSLFTGFWLYHINWCRIFSINRIQWSDISDIIRYFSSSQLLRWISKPSTVSSKKCFPNYSFRECHSFVCGAPCANLTAPWKFLSFPGKFHPKWGGFSSQLCFGSTPQDDSGKQKFIEIPDPIEFRECKLTRPILNPTNPHDFVCASPPASSQTSWGLIPASASVSLWQEGDQFAWLLNMLYMVLKPWFYVSTIL